MFTFGNKHIPGSVVAHHPWFRQMYVGSPSLCRLSETEYYATHDLFGPKSYEYESPVTRIYKTTNAGVSWKRLPAINGSFWARIFTHHDNLYVFGVDKHHGNLVIRRSTNQGITWTQPKTSTTGLLRKGKYHAASTPVVVHQGRLWLACERADGPATEWGKCYGAVLFSAAVDTDLLASASWQESSTQYFNNAYLKGSFGGFLEGNVVVTPTGAIHNLLRVEDDSTYKEKAALMTLERDNHLSFNSDNDFVSFPGGSKKFTVRYDAISGLYISLSNVIAENELNIYSIEPDQIRDRVALVVSADLRTWQTVRTVLTATNFYKFAFQYIDWDFDGDDIIFLSRTAAADWYGGARSYHDANFLTFHRIVNFRSNLTSS